MHHELVGTDVGCAVGAVLVAGIRKRHEPGKAPSAKPSRTILVVDNDPILRMLVARFLVLSGYAVLEAPMGSEALALTQRHRGRIDLLLTDVVMPGMSGFELAESLTRSHPECAVLFMSGHVEDFPVVREAYEMQPSTFLVKPFWCEALLEKVREVVGDPGPSSSGMVG